MKKSIDKKEIYSRRIRSIKWRFSFFVLFLICTDETYNRLKLQKKKNLHNVHSIRKQRLMKNLEILLVKKGQKTIVDYY